MAHDFDHSRPDHVVHHIHRPEGHAAQDEKFDKMGRSPMAGSLPDEAGLASPDLDEGQSVGPASPGL